MPWQGTGLRRFAVRIEDLRGVEHRYCVATRRSEAKAIALAVTRHQALRGGHVYDVEVELIEALAASADGTREAAEAAAYLPGAAGGSRIGP